MHHHLPRAPLVGCPGVVPSSLCCLLFPLPAEDSHERLATRRLAPLKADTAGKNAIVGPAQLAKEPLYAQRWLVGHSWRNRPERTLLLRSLFGLGAQSLQVQI